MKFDNKAFQQKYEAWKNGADYWKDIRGINLGGDAQADEPTPEEQEQINSKIQSILNEYDAGKGVPKYKGGKNDYINEFVNRMAPLVGQQLNRYGYTNDSTFYNVMRQLAWESNYGRSRVAREQHNYGGVGFNGKDYTAYKDDKDFVEKYMRLMHNRYSAALRAKSPQDYARALKQKGYYTDTLDHYTSGLVGMQSVTRAAALHRANHNKDYDYNVKLQDLIDDYEDVKSASPIVINSPSVEQPATIRADVSKTLLGPTAEEIKTQQYMDLQQKVYDYITTPTPLPQAMQKMLQGNNFGKDAQKKLKLPKFGDGQDQTIGGEIVKALGGGEVAQEFANFGTQMIPGVGTYYDWKTAVNDPTLANIGTALLTTAGDIFTLGAGGLAIRASIKAAKAAKEYRAAKKIWETSKKLAPGTAQTRRALRIVSDASDNSRAAMRKVEAINHVRNSVKANVATHLTDVKDGYGRIKEHFREEKGTKK